MNFKELQKWKAEEFESFFQTTDNYYLYLNHLGEIKWMTEDEAEEQHEFYIYDESRLQNFRKRIKPRKSVNYEKLPEDEREYRLQIRKYLEERYAGGIQGQTADHLPRYFKRELTTEEIDHIPITLNDIQDRQLGKSILLLATVLIAVVAFVVYLSVGNAPAATGSLLVDSNIEAARVYLDNQQFGYTGQQISNLPVGQYAVSVGKPGFVAVPSSRMIAIGADSLTRLSIELQPDASVSNGNLVITAPFSDSKIFIDDDYFGKLDETELLTLPEGQHKIILEKAGYASLPAEQIVTIRAGDTAMISFEQEFSANARPVMRKSRSSVNRGSLEVQTNQIGGKILLNGRDTGKEADYVFSDLPFGTYTIQVVKEGFESVPLEQEITLNAETASAEVAFKLTPAFQQMTVSVVPENAPILIDGEVKGKGKATVRLDPGSYTLSFGDVPGYKTPKSRRITIDDNKPADIRVEYFPVIKVSAAITNDGNVGRENCDVYAGYTFKNRGFSSSEEAGPEIVFHEGLEQYVWKCGYAFPFRNPKGNDALKFSFNLPKNTTSAQKITLLLQAVATEEKYPLTFAGKSDIRVKFNGHILSYNYSPKTVEDLSGLENIRWDISTFAKPGINSIEITTTDDNNRYYLVKSVSVFN